MIMTRTFRNDGMNGRNPPPTHTKKKPDDITVRPDLVNSHQQSFRLTSYVTLVELTS